MFSSFYIAASGVLMQQRVMNTISNNIANINTPGFRTQRVVSSTFEEVLQREENGQKTELGKGSPIRTVKEVESDFDESYLEETGRPFDMAIVGDGYFHIQGADRVYMTRNGNFDIDEQGFLVLRGVGRVLGEKGELEVKDANFEVKQDGTIYDSTGKAIDKVKVAVPAEGVEMIKYGNGLYGVPDATQNVAAAGSSVYQGQIENSNIDVNREYTMALEAMRTFQSCSNALKLVDQLNQKTAAIASLS